MSSSSTDDSVLVGTLGRPHGLKGELTIQIESDNAGRFTPGTVLKTDSGDTLTVTRLRHGPKAPLISFEECPDRATAETLRGRQLVVDADDRRELEEGEYWPEDLMGLEAITDSGPLGTVVDVIVGNHQDRVVIDDGEKEIEIPLVSDLVPDVDFESGTITITPIDGLIPPPEEG